MCRITPEIRFQRVRIANEVADGGGNITDFGHRLGVSTVAALKFIRDACPTTYRRLLDGRRRPALSEQDVIARLEHVWRAEQLGLTRKATARRLGITGSALSYWLRRNAPDGVEAALAELREDAA